MVGGNGQILFTFLHKKIACEMVLRKESTALHLIFHSIQKISIFIKNLASHLLRFQSLFLNFYSSHSISGYCESHQIDQNS